LYLDLGFYHIVDICSSIREIWNTIHKIIVHEIVAVMAIVTIVKIVAIHCIYLDKNYVM